MRKNSFSQKPFLFPFIIVLLGVVSLGSFFLLTSPQKNRYAVQRGKSYFTPIPIIHFNRPGIPCVAVTIENKTISAELDLGFRGELGFSSDFLRELKRKKYLRSKIMYGVRGVGYEKKIYEHPEVFLGNAIFSQPTSHEEVQEMHQGSSCVRKKGETPTQTTSRIGWELFRKKNLCLDLNNSLVSLCSDIDMLKEQGYPTDTFVKVPLLTERGLLEFYAETPTGPIRCMIDTGASKNILNTELKEGQTIEQAVWDPNNIQNYDSFLIDGQDFGNTDFLRIPIRIPIHIEAILGMDFLSTHVVFLDFAKGFVYFGE